MNKMDVQQYLERIKYDGNTAPAGEVLKSLQKKHLLTVPFENLDIHYKIPIELNLDKIYEKVINRRRGGFCYELNGLFYQLLQSIGFEAKMVSARVFNNNTGIFSQEFDHLAIIAKADSMDYLVDVGFGEFAIQPLKMELDNMQHDERCTFRIRTYDEVYFVVESLLDKEWRSVYIFSSKKRDLSEFQERCYYHQTSPQSHFVQNKLCSLATVKGRITLTSNKMKITEDNTITELNLESEEEFLSYLEKYFQIRLNSPVAL